MTLTHQDVQARHKQAIDAYHDFAAQGSPVDRRSKEWRVERTKLLNAVLSWRLVLARVQAGEEPIIAVMSR